MLATQLYIMAVNFVFNKLILMIINGINHYRCFLDEFFKYLGRWWMHSVSRNRLYIRKQAKTFDLDIALPGELIVKFKISQSHIALLWCQ